MDASKRPRTPPIERICQYCKIAFWAKQSEVKKGHAKFCSKQCYFLGALKLIPRNCLQCGISFKEHPSDIELGRGKYCSRSCYYKSKIGEGNPNWKGGTHITNGYRVIDQRGRAQEGEDNRRIFEHRLIMEKIVGRELTANEVVHHVDENRLNNSPENLQLLTRAEHAILHHGANGQWTRGHDSCVSCGETTRKHQGRGLCSRCHARSRYVPREQRTNASQI